MSPPLTELWDTTNKDYGRFYAALKEKSVANSDKRCEELAKELKVCQKELKKLRLRNKNAKACEGVDPNRSLKHFLRYQFPESDLRLGSPKYSHSKSYTRYWEDEEQRRRKVRQSIQDVSNTKPWSPPIDAYTYKLLSPSEFNMKYPGKRYGKKKYVEPPEKLQTFAEMPNAVSPITSRYDYYKYWGFGGQGAKTSWAHNFPLGSKAPYTANTHGLPKL